MTTKLNYKLTHLLQARVQDRGEKIFWSGNDFRVNPALQKKKKKGYLFLKTMKRRHSLTYVIYSVFSQDTIIHF